MFSHIIFHCSEDWLILTEMKSGAYNVLSDYSVYDEDYLKVTEAV